MSGTDTSATDEQVDDSRVESTPMRWYARLAKKLRWRIHALMPNVIPSPHRDDRIYYEETDPLQNEATRVPVEEQVRLRVMWGAELFGPAEVDNLYEYLQKLGWDEDRGIPGHNAVNWIRTQRDYGSSGDFNIGVVSRKGSGYSARHHAPLPREVDYLLVKISQLTSSLTCVLVGFVFKEDYTQSYEEQLLLDRRTTHRRENWTLGYETRRPEHLKRDSIDSVRSKSIGTVVRWFQKNLPGFFCSIAGGGKMPTGELITTKNETLLKCRHEWDRNEPEWLSLLVPHGWGDVWINERDGLRLRFGELSGIKPHHTIVSLRTSIVTDEDLRFSGDRTSGAFVAFAHERLEGILSHHASIAFLLEISRSLKQSQQGLKTATLSHGHVLRSIETIKRFFDRSLGVPAVVSELNKKSEHVRSYSWACGTFREAPLREGDEAREIAEVLRAQTAHVSARVLVDEETTREHFDQIATIISTRESVKTQRRMEVLTVITVVLALCSLLAALPSSWVKALETQVVSSSFANRVVQNLRQRK